MDFLRDETAILEEYRFNPDYSNTPAIPALKAILRARDLLLSLLDG